jgi:hypothetical protein
MHYSVGHGGFSQSRHSMAKFGPHVILIKANGDQRTCSCTPGSSTHRP